MRAAAVSFCLTVYFGRFFFATGVAFWIKKDIAEAETATTLLHSPPPQSECELGRLGQQPTLASGPQHGLAVLGPFIAYRKAEQHQSKCSHKTVSLVHMILVFWSLDS